MPPKFGTSGLRGLVTELTEELVANYTRAFLSACDFGAGLFVGHDLRPSSPDLAQVLISTARAEGVDVTDCGHVPTPALALASMRAEAAAVMVTGSHIPADRNGLKFYSPKGEITKADETAILARLGRPAADTTLGRLSVNSSAGRDWVERYVTAFGNRALAGRRIGIWSHSAVSRDLLAHAMSALGASAIEVGRVERFIPLDTEAVPDWARTSIRAWVDEFDLDALVSTDGDGDRPLLADDTGAVIPGDILGQITAQLLRAETVVTPVTSNSGAELSGQFMRVLRTKVGSPFVIAGIEAVGGRVVGYEANGGFLLGFDAAIEAPLPMLMTRDSMLPIVATLATANGKPLSSLLACQPQRRTAANRIEDVPIDRATATIARLTASDENSNAFLTALGEEQASRNMIDGLRLVCASSRIVHLRPSGNAPEFRVYVEAETADRAEDLLQKAIHELSRQLHA